MTEHNIHTATTSCKNIFLVQCECFSTWIYSDERTFHEEEFVSLKTVLEWNIASNEIGNMTIQLLKALPPFGHAGLLYDTIWNIQYNSHSCSDHVVNPL